MALTANPPARRMPSDDCLVCVHGGGEPWLALHHPLAYGCTHRTACGGAQGCTAPLAPDGGRSPTVKA